jgi:hypothetical protein
VKERRRQRRLWGVKRSDMKYLMVSWEEEAKRGLLTCMLVTV